MRLQRGVCRGHGTWWRHHHLWAHQDRIIGFTAFGVTVTWGKDAPR